MMRIILGALCLIPIASAIPIFKSSTLFEGSDAGSKRTSLWEARFYESHFEQFIVAFNKDYATEEEKVHRFWIFVKNFDFIHSWNATESGVTVGVNEFADLSHDEFKRFYLGYKPTADVQALIDEAHSPEKKACTCQSYSRKAKSGKKHYCENFSTHVCHPYDFGFCDGSETPCKVSPSPPTPPPGPTPPPAPPSPGDSIDWVAKGAVTPVKNQAQCGSCWAFSTTGGLEGAIFVKHNVLESLSEEELVQCDKVDDGCQGGAMEDGFEFIKKTKGIATEAQYPYTKATGGGKTGKCVTSSEKPVAKYTSEVSGYTKVKANSEAALKEAVKMHPVSVAVEADKQVFQFYKKGIIKAGKACGYKLDHGVLAVGYGTDAGTMYWKVKNSWGPSWGDKGFLRVERTDSASSKGTCGIAMDASYPNLSAANPLSTTH